MNWYEDLIIARLVAEEKIAPKQRRYHKTPSKISTTSLRPLLRALLSWLF
jgi:hypothetical protein